MPSPATFSAFSPLSPKSLGFPSPNLSSLLTQPHKLGLSQDSEPADGRSPPQPAPGPNPSESPLSCGPGSLSSLPPVPRSRPSAAAPVPSAPPLSCCSDSLSSLPPAPQNLLSAAAPVPSAHSCLPLSASPQLRPQFPQLASAYASEPPLSSRRQTPPPPARPFPAPPLRPCLERLHRPPRHAQAPWEQRAWLRGAAASRHRNAPHGESAAAAGPAGPFRARRARALHPPRRAMPQRPVPGRLSSR